MKHSFALTIAAIATTSYAQSDPKLVEHVSLPCTVQVETVVKSLRTQYGEIPLLKLDTKDGEPFVLFINTETGTWTLARSFGEKICAVGAGTAFQFNTQSQEPKPSL